MEERRCVYKILVGKPEGKRPIERSRRRRDNNIKNKFQGIAWDAVDLGRSSPR